MRLNILRKCIEKFLHLFVITSSSCDHRTLGKLGEIEACKYLAQKGLKILDKNVRLGRYEIDIVAKDRDELVFVEVKTRKNSQWRYPEDDVGWYKRRNLKRAGAKYLKTLASDDTYYRFDVVAITWEPEVEIHWIKNAF